MITLQDGQVQSAEQREKDSHSHRDHQHEHEAGVHPRQQMIETIRDCQVLIAGGMGQPMYERGISHGLEVYLAIQDRISDVVEAYQK